MTGPESESAIRSRPSLVRVFIAACAGCFVQVINNVYNHVGRMWYGFQQPTMVSVRRVGKPRTEHQKELCQACSMGICREAKAQGRRAAASTASTTSATTVPHADDAVADAIQPVPQSPRVQSHDTTRE
jgi:hypothetical protein